MSPIHTIMNKEASLSSSTPTFSVRAVLVRIYMAFSRPCFISHKYLFARVFFLLSFMLMFPLVKKILTQYSSSSSHSSSSSSLKQSCSNKRFLSTMLTTRWCYTINYLFMFSSVFIPWYTFALFIYPLFLFCFFGTEEQRENVSPST